jgi:hypothetical protein
MKISMKTLGSSVKHVKTFEKLIHIRNNNLMFKSQVDIK